MDNKKKSITTAPLCNLLVGLLIFIQAPILLGFAGQEATIGVLPWVLCAYPIIVIAVIFMIINGQLLDATVNGILSIVLLGQNFAKGLIWLSYTSSGSLPSADLQITMSLIDGLGFLVGSIVLAVVGALNFKSNKLAGICIWCCAIGFASLFLAFYSGIAVFALIGAAGLLILAVFLLYAGIAELLACAKALAASEA